MSEPALQELLDQILIEKVQVRESLKGELTNAEVAWLPLKKRVGDLLGRSLLAKRGSRWLLAGLLCWGLKGTHRTVSRNTRGSWSR